MCLSVVEVSGALRLLFKARALEIPGFGEGLFDVVQKLFQHHRYVGDFPFEPAERLSQQTPASQGAFGGNQGHLGRTVVVFRSARGRCFVEIQPVQGAA